MKPPKYYLWFLNPKNWKYKKGFCWRCSGFDCTAHCCPKRCWIYPDQRICATEYEYNNCPHDFKNRKLG